MHQYPIHYCELLNDVELKNIENLHLLVNEAKNKVNYFQDQYSTMDNNLADLQDQLEVARGNIDETYQSYKSILEKRRVSCQEKNRYFRLIYFFFVFFLG